MFFVIMLFMTLFTVFCAVILGLGISSAFGGKGGEKPIGAGTPRARNDEWE